MMISLKSVPPRARLPKLDDLDSDGYLLVPREGGGYDIWRRQQSQACTIPTLRGKEPRR